MKKTLVISFCIALSIFAGNLYSISVNDGIKNGTEPIDVWILSEDGTESWINRDNNSDGKADYSLRIDETARKISETMDFNFDGSMDDYYYYDAGVLRSREIDTNYDGSIDLRDYLEDGVYMARIERDLDFDGEFDYIKSYVEE